MTVIQLRPATKADARLLFDWRNDPMTRQNSIDTAEVAWDDHVRWLSACLADDDRRLFIAEEGGRPVGTSRLDHNAGRFALSWTVAPSQRGRGVGKAIVRKTVADAGVPILFASIKAENVASARIAEACGFRRLDCIDGLALYRFG